MNAIQALRLVANKSFSRMDESDYMAFAGVNSDYALIHYPDETKGEIYTVIIDDDMIVAIDDEGYETLFRINLEEFVLA